MRPSSNQPSRVGGARVPDFEAVRVLHCRCESLRQHALVFHNHGSRRLSTAYGDEDEEEEEVDGDHDPNDREGDPGARDAEILEAHRPGGADLAAERAHGLVPQTASDELEEDVVQRRLALRDVHDHALPRDQRDYVSRGLGPGVDPHGQDAIGSLDGADPLNSPNAFDQLG